MMQTRIKVGDRVRFIRADGSLDGEVEVHDVFGENGISFLSGSVEQLYHADLVHRVGDDTPVAVPVAETWFIAIGNNHGWGRARTEKQAIANMRRQGGKPTQYVVYRVNQWTRVNDMGGLSHPRGYGEPIEVKRTTKVA